VTPQQIETVRAAVDEAVRGRVMSPGEGARLLRQALDEDPGTPDAMLLAPIHEAIARHTKSAHREAQKRPHLRLVHG
jgi:hypothetical protein